MLRGLFKSRQRLAGLARSYATAELAVKESSPFLRFATPFPQEYNHLQALGTIPDTKVTVLDSGLRVASETTPFAETATIGVWIDAGSRFENDATNGSAHFLEHMAFKGTKTRTRRDLELEIENMGGHLDAYTSRELTCYFARVFKKDVPKATAILADILQESNLDKAAIERERDVILREMQEVGTIPEEVIFDHLHATAFQHSPLGRTILGTQENISQLTRDDLANYIATHYTAPRMVVVGAGAVEHDDLVKLADKEFASLSNRQSTTTAEELVAADPAIFTGSDVRIRDPDSQTIHLAVAFKGASWTDPDSVPLSVMQTLLGSYNKGQPGGMNSSSELAQKLSINNLVTSYQAFNTLYHDSGLFGIFLAADKDMDMNDATWAIMREMSKLPYNVDAEQITRAKNQLKSQHLFVRETPQGIAEDIGRQMLAYGRRIPMAEMFARIDAVDADTIRAVADRFIYDQELAIAALGSTQFVPDYTWFRRRTYWLRY